MLVLSRHTNEKIIIPLEEIKDLQGDIEIIVVEIRGDKVRLGFNANPTVPIHREEVQKAIRRSRTTSPE